MRVSVIVAAVAALLLVAPACRAEMSIKIDQGAQQMTVTRDGTVVGHWTVSTGRRAYRTPVGTFTPTWLDAKHISKEWDDAPMPHSIFFTNGIAIHGTYETKYLGAPVSHGCVRLSPGHAAALFAMVQKEGLANVKVTVSGNVQEAYARERRTRVAAERDAQSEQTSFAATAVSPAAASAYDAADAPVSRRFFTPAY
ncbi:MAG TPA: L,D-transpeptidase [Pseudolabrys sp.]|nr:L,D-transpeptidase [Pseudolabrys sp.]